MSLSSRSRAAGEKRKKKEEEKRSPRKSAAKGKQALTANQRKGKKTFDDPLAWENVKKRLIDPVVNRKDKGGSPAKPAKDDKPQTFSQAFAAARKAQGPGGTFTWKGKKFTTDRADDKPASNGSGSNGSGNNKSENKKGGFFKNLGKKIEKATTLTPGRPRKPRGKVGMNSPQMRKYKADMKKWRESQSKKAAGGRVVAKKAAKKKAAKKVARKKTMARTSVKKKSPRRP